MAVTPKVFETLLYLLRNRDRILPREEILGAVWQGRRVEEANLTQTVSVLRKALGESEGVKYIGTFPGRGYRFLAEVEETEAPVATVRPGGERKRLAWVGLAAGLALLGLFWWQRRMPDRPGAAPVRRLLTSLPGNEFHPALSADGRLIAYVWDGEQEQSPAIYIRPVDEDAARPLCPSYSAQFSPAWSPDGRFVAYLRQDTDSAALVVSPVRGGEERVVTHLYRSRYGITFPHLDWSPDGRWLVFDDKEKESDALGLFLVQVESGERRRLTAPSAAIIGDVAPRFSPDGQQVAFVRMTYRFDHDLYLAPAMGGEARPLTTDHRQIGGLDWRRDGEAVLFSSDRAGGFTVFEAPLDGGRAKSLGIAGNHPLQISTARQSARIAYSEFAQDLNIWRLVPEWKSGPRWERVIASTALDAMPQVSPDGQWISFRSDRDGREKIWVAPSGGGEARALSRGDDRPFAGRWSPDSRQLVTGTLNADGADVALLPLSGGVPRRLTGKGISHSHPFFSAEGHVLAVSGGAVLRYDPASGALSRKSVEGWHSPHGMRLGDEGRSVYFVPGRTATTIWRGDLQTGAAQPVLDGLLAGHWGSWSLCGRAIYYLGPNALDGDRPWVMRRALEPNAPAQPLTAWTGPLPPIGTSLWSSDPRSCHLYVERIDRGNTDVVLLENQP